MSLAQKFNCIIEEDEDAASKLDQNDSTSINRSETPAEKSTKRQSYSPADAVRIENYSCKIFCVTQIQLGQTKQGNIYGCLRLSQKSLFTFLS